MRKATVSIGLSKEFRQQFDVVQFAKLLPTGRQYISMGDRFEAKNTRSSIDRLSTSSGSPDKVYFFIKSRSEYPTANADCAHLSL